MKEKHILISKQIKKVIKDFEPEIGVVLGSGWGKVVDSIKNPITISYESLKGMPKTTVAGHTGNLIFGEVAGKKVVFLQGRFHYYEGNKMEDVVLPVRMLKQLGVKTFIVTNAAGGVNEKYNVGDIVIINDHINYTGQNPLIGLHATKEQPIFVDMTTAYDPKHLATAKKVLTKLNLPTHSGTYVQFTGPTYETPAEIKMVRKMGGDLVGMSTVLEVIMARYEGLRVLGLSCVTNMAAGILSTELSHKEVLEATQNNKEKLQKVLTETIKAIK